MGTDRRANIAAQTASIPKRYTLLLGVMSTGSYCWQLIEGSCTGFLFAAYLRKVGEVLKDENYLAICFNAAIHRTLVVNEASNEVGMMLRFPPAY